MISNRTTGSLCFLVSGIAAALLTLNSCSGENEITPSQSSVFGSSEYSEEEVWSDPNDNLPEGRTFYVKNSHPGASDTNPGTPRSPWRFCPGMPGWRGDTDLEPGDRVVFWNQDTWTASGGNALIQATGGVTYDGGSWGEGSRAILRAEGKLSRSVVNIMDDDPAHPTTFYGFELDANKQHAAGVGMNWPKNTRDLTGATKGIINCVVHDVSSRSSRGEYAYGIIIGGWGNRKIANVEVVDCKIYNISRGGIDLYPGNDVPTNRASNILVQGCEVYNTGLDPDSPGTGAGIGIKNHVVDALVQYNYIHHAKSACVLLTVHRAPGFRGPERVTVRHNILTNSKKWGIYIQDPGDKEADIYGNIIANNYYEGLVLAQSLADSLRLKVYNNTFYHNYYTRDWGSEIRLQNSSAICNDFEFYNNIVVAGPRTIPVGDDQNKLIHHGNNLYFREGGGDIVRTGGSRYDADEIQQWEPTAIVAWPEFIDTTSVPEGFNSPRGNGLALDHSSPALDKGAPLGTGYSTSINATTRPAGNGWDLGAYEMEQNATGVTNPIKR
ncbi:MAG: hypothetical protein GF401_00155 [Chitinivibrionales bacterium]|nr:hypothetical protein [Chitinivibrionales bacterium]